MRDQYKTKEELINELLERRQRVAELESSEAVCRQTIEDITRQKELADSFIALMQDGLSVVDVNGVQLDVNPSLCQMTGFSREELIGVGPPHPYWPPEEYEDINRAFHKTLGHEFDNFELIFMRKTGERFPVIVNLSELRDHYGNITSYFATVKNITDSKKMEERIKHLNLVLRAIRNVNRLITKEKDREKLLKGACDNLIETRGYYNAWIALLDESGKLVAHAESGLGESFMPMVKCLKHGQLPACGQRALKQSEAVVIEDPVSTCTDCPLSSNSAGRSAATVRLEYGGKVYGLLSVSVAGEMATDVEELGLFHEVATDIALALYNIELEEQRKQAEEALKASEQEKGSILNAISDIVVLQDKSLSILWVNNVGAQSAGKSSQELVGQHCYELWHGRNEPCEKCPVLETLKTGAHADGTMTTPDGRQWEIKGEPVRNIAGEIIGAIEVARDITERKQAEEALRESEEKLKRMFESATDGIVVTDLNGNIIEVNESAVRLYGSDSKEKLIGRSAFEFIAEKDRAQVMEVLKSALEDGQIRRNVEITFLTEDGREYFAEVSSALLKDASGNPVGFIAITRDITERKKAEEEIRKLLFAVEQSPSMIVITDIDGNIEYVNPKVTQVTGYNSEELIKEKAGNLGEQAPEEYKQMWDTIISGGEWRGEFRNKKKDGEFYWEAASISPVRNTEGVITHFVKVAEDITERKKEQEKLMLNDRLASVGELASGIAHELNNPLTSVIGFTQLLLERDISDDIRDDLKTIYSEARRTAEVVKNLLTFARKHPPAKQLINMNSIINKVLQMRAYEQRVSNIHVITRFAPDLPEVIADYFQVQQVFLNIIINAEYFMLEAHQRGTLTITTERTEGIVKVSFADDGPGISKENLGHLFDPFFTTKEIGKGTGLGLSICHGIITEHGGGLYAKSEPGRGATLIVELPISVC